MRLAVSAVAALVLAGCGGSSDSPQTEESETPSPSLSPGSSPSATPADRSGQIDTPSGGWINYFCSGTGEPANLLEAGSDSAGTQQYSSRVIDPLAERMKVCTYDRPGTGLSRDLPDHRRTLSGIPIALPGW